MEYELSIDGSSGAETLTLLGKIRAKGLDRKTPALMADLARNGFAADSVDGVSIPEVMGDIPEFQMWLQRKVPGVPLTNWLAGADGLNMACRVAEAASSGCSYHGSGNSILGVISSTASGVARSASVKLGQVITSPMLPPFAISWLR